MDIREINREIKDNIDSGFRVDSIRVNLKHHTPDIEKEEQPKVIDLWQRITSEQFDYNVTVEPSDDSESLADYRIVCSSCEGRPFYDESQKEHYCTHCEQTEERSIFNY